MEKLKATPEQVKWLYAHRNDRTLTRKDKARHLGITEVQVANMMYRYAIHRDKLTDAAHEVAREYDRNYRKKKKAK